MEKAGLDFHPGSLLPTNPLSCGRYGDRPGILLNHLSILPGDFLRSRPKPLPPNWVPYVHPEGQLYFHRHDAGLRVVTDAHMFDNVISSAVIYWTSVVEKLLLQQNMAISDQMELCLFIKNNDCTYYLADDASKSIFWVQPVSTQDLDLTGVICTSHLKLHIERLFWKHTEHYPMHKTLTRQSVDDLLSIFSHNLAEKLTSKASTFFHSADSTADFVQLLKTAREHINDGHQICLVARLWAYIMFHRFSVHYGTERSRLDRTQSVLYADPAQIPILNVICSNLSFKAFEKHLKKLEHQFVDRFLYVEHWQRLVASNLKEWQETAYMALGSLTMHLFAMFLPASSILGIISFGLSGGSFISAVLLMHRYKYFETAPLDKSYQHVVGMESSRCGFQLVALAYALPLALYLWGLLFMTLNCIYVLAVSVNPWIALAVLISVAIAFLAFQYATSSFNLSSLVPNCLRRRTDAKVQIV
ncbi:hypothetical protein C8J56DRAFT_1047282 [Mycena floridula]|nr:hypothetical protein C8J56DRAFT_1047282 [Mycena floridula]